MFAIERPVDLIGTEHRMVVRHIPSHELEAAYRALELGRSESEVCYNLGLNHELFSGLLMPAIEEVLWERGRLGEYHPANDDAGADAICAGCGS